MKTIVALGLVAALLAPVAMAHRQVDWEEETYYFDDELAADHLGYYSVEDNGCAGLQEEVSNCDPTDIEPEPADSRFFVTEGPFVGALLP